MLVTGSGSPRVGRAIARFFIEHGCRVALHGNTTSEQARQVARQWQTEFGIDTLAVSGSLDDDATCERLVDETANHFGRLDVLVNSAAIWSPTKLSEISGDEIRRYFQINAVATLLCSRAAGNVMVSQPFGGSIVNLGDWATVRPYADHAAYFPSKGAVEAITRSLAVELGAQNSMVRVNCVQPGPVLLDDTVAESTRQKLASSTLAGRIGTPEEVAHAVAFLSSNRFVTGVCLPVDGGRQIFAPDGLQLGENTG